MKIKEESPKQTSSKIFVISGGHFFHDLYTSFLAPLLPTIIDNLSLSLTSAGILTTFSRIPSLLQLVFGYYADRIGARYFVILSPAITATLMSLIGNANSFYSLALVLFLAGTSSAMFHATSPGLVASESGNRKGFGLSIFMAGGGIGRSLGPILVVWALSIWGLNGIFRLMVLGWSASIFLYFQFRNVAYIPQEKPSFRAALPIFQRFFIPLALVILLRSTLIAALSTYLPVYLVQTGAPIWMAGAALSVLELAGVTGALFIGPLSDKIGRRKSINISIIISVLLVPLFLLAQGWLIFPVLLFLGFFCLSTGTIFLALVQDHFFDHRATGNGFYLSISFLSNGLMLILIGMIGDRFGLEIAYVIGAIAALCSIPALTLLPKSRS